MALNATELINLVERELNGVRDDRVVGHIRSLIVEPNVVMRGWDYGRPNQEYPCWTVLNDGDTGIAYCEHGFGPRCPWGLVFIGNDESGRTSMGMDSAWFPTFMEAYFNSFASTELPIWRVFSMDGGAPGNPLTNELSWTEAWARCEDARTHNPGSHFMVHHSILYGA